MYKFNNNKSLLFFISLYGNFDIKNDEVHVLN